MLRVIGRILVVSVFLGFAGLQAGEMSELQKRKAFAEAYASAKPEQRVAAVQLLNGCTEDATFLWLVQAAKNDEAPAVRLAAYNLISQWDDPMGRMEQVLLGIFFNENNRETKIVMCQVFPKLKTKSAAIEAMIKFFGTCTHPSSSNWNDDRYRNYNRNNNGGNGAVYLRRRSDRSIAAARKEFTEVLGVVNALTGQSFPASNKSRISVKKWWTMNQIEFIKADAATQKRLEAEARIAANNKSKSGKAESELE